MSARRARRQSARMLAMLPQPTGSASAKVQLGLRLRQDASLTGCCACGATAETFEIAGDGTLSPVSEPTAERGRAYYVRLLHEHDCPAASPELERALQRGEISDPAGDLLRGLRAP